MTGLAVGLAGGCGLLLVWWACCTPADDVPARRPAARRGRWDQDLRAAGTSMRTVSLWSVAAALVGAALALTLTRVPALAVLAGAAGCTLPGLRVRRLALRRRARLRDAWPEAVDNLASAVRAGLALPEALTQLGVGGPAVLRPAFARFAQEYRATGRLTPALDVLREELADPVGDRVVAAIGIARDTGGSDLGRLLRALSTFLRQDARLRSELEGRQGWTVNAARLAVAAPWVLLLLLASRPESIAAYRTSTGSAVLAVGAAVSVASYRLMLRIARLPDELRVLR